MEARALFNQMPRRIDRGWGFRQDSLLNYLAMLEEFTRGSMKVDCGNLLKAASLILPEIPD
jgi:hypothetical protein